MPPWATSVAPFVQICFGEKNDFSLRPELESGQRPARPLPTIRKSQEREGNFLFKAIKQT